jgi:hypothetical protein
MITVEKLIKKLEKFPKDAKCFAYEGEDVGLTIEYENKETKTRAFDFIRCTSKDVED